MRVAICDDNDIIRTMMRETCELYFKDKGSFEIVEYASGEECLAAERPDILLLDIEMGAVSGIDVKDQLEKEGADTRIIFVTNYDSLMADAFGKNVYGFLSKPLDEEKFGEKMERIFYDIEEAQRFIQVQTAENYKKIYLRNILYMEAVKKDVDIYTVKGRMAAVDRIGINQWAAELQDKSFVLTHKSFLVNLAHVKKIDRKVVLDNDVQIKLSRDRKPDVEKLYRRYVLDHIK